MYATHVLHQIVKTNVQTHFTISRHLIVVLFVWKQLDVEYVKSYGLHAMVIVKKSKTEFTRKIVKY